MCNESVYTWGIPYPQNDKGLKEKWDYLKYSSWSHVPGTYGIKKKTKTKKDNKKNNKKKLTKKNKTKTHHREER